MANQIIENYIASNYQRWLGWARSLCSSRRISTQNAEDLVQDVLLVLHRRHTEQEVINMLSTHAYRQWTLLDLFINRAIHYMARNLCRHLWCVRTKINDVDISLQVIPVMDQRLMSL